MEPRCGVGWISAYSWRISELLNASIAAKVQEQFCINRHLITLNVDEWKGQLQWMAYWERSFRAHFILGRKSFKRRIEYERQSEIKRDDSKEDLTCPILEAWFWHLCYLKTTNVTSELQQGLFAFIIVTIKHASPLKILSFSVQSQPSLPRVIIES